MPRLVTVREGNTLEYELAGETIIGRSSQCTIRLNSGKASRKHARIIQSGESWLVEDLGSSNGTRLNGIKVNSATLKDGDRIRIGLDEFVFQEIINDPILGTRLGNYQVLERIGRGGMGTVYRAKQISMDRDVAFKVLKPELSCREDLIQSFTREARLAGRLQHPNIIAIYDFGKEDGHYFFSMEFVRGRNLMDEIEQRGVLPPKKVIEYSIMIAGALEHAHAQNILHQDIKPRNIMLSEQGEIKLADLGLARVMADDKAKQSGQPMGTPQYVAPEIIRMQPADARTDIYSLAATMYQMATGLPPYQGSSAEEILQKHLNSPVPDPRLVESNVPDMLAEIIMRGLAKDPAKRPADCRELQQALNRARSALGKKPKSRAAPVPSTSAPADAAPVRERAAKSAVQQAMTDHTDNLPAVNPYRPVAIAICSLASVLLAALIAYGLYGVIRGEQASEPARMLQEARRFVQNHDIEGAKGTLMDIQELYPDSVEAVEASKILARIEADSGTATRASDTTPQNSDTAQTNTSHHPTPATTPTTAAVDNKQKRAEKAWNAILPVIDRHLDKNQYSQAISTLTSFTESYEGTDIAEVASRKLASVRSLVREMGERMLREARQQKASGNLAGAGRTLGEILTKLAATSWADKARQELASIDDAAKAQLFALWSRLSRNLTTMDVDGIQTAAQRTAASLRGLPWAAIAADLAEEANALKAYRSRLFAAVRKLNANNKVSVEGMGLCSLKISGTGKLLAISGRKQTGIEWQRISADDIWLLAPAWILGKDVRIGAALHFMGRKHYGYMLTCLKKLQVTGKLGRIQRQMQAQRKNRLMIAWLDFSELSVQQRWKRLDGEWRFRDGNLESHATETARMELNDTLFSLRNLAMDFTATPKTGSGQVAVILFAEPDKFLAVRRKGAGLTLEFVNNGQPRRSQGRVRLPNQPLRLTIRNNKAVLSQGNAVLCQVQAGGIQSWRSRLRLEVLEATGVFRDIMIAEGR